MNKGYFIGLLIVALSVFGVYMFFSGQANNLVKQHRNTQASSTTTFYADREAVATAAHSALPDYLLRLSQNQKADYGFQSDADLAKAYLLPPLPTFMPDRTISSLNKNDIQEDIVNRSPDMWFVPVAVGHAIACLIEISADESNKPKAVSFGSTYKAKRIEAGLRVLGWPDFNRWQDLRLLSFYGPTVDLLLAKEDNGQWVWINLTGTSEVKPIVLDIGGISRVLETINNSTSAD